MALTDLKTALYNRLTTVTSKVYSGKAPTNAVFPYCVYKLPSSNPIDSREDFILEVDCWDNKSSTTALETLTQDIATALNYYVFSNANIALHMYKIFQGEIPDTDTTISRRQLRFQVKTYLLN